MAHNKQIELNPLDIDLLVKCLHREIGTVSSRTFNNRHPQHKEAKADLDQLQSLLGKLHTQQSGLQEQASR